MQSKTRSVGFRITPEMYEQLLEVQRLYAERLDFSQNLSQTFECMIKDSVRRMKKQQKKKAAKTIPEEVSDRVETELEVVVEDTLPAEILDIRQCEAGNDCDASSEEPNDPNLLTFSITVDRDGNLRLGNCQIP